MRRSASVQLTILSAASLALVACSKAPPEGETVFSTTEACMEAFGSNGQSACSTAFTEARTAHLATAPRFADAARCEAETGGRCEEVGKPGLVSYAIPVMAGVLLGRALADGSRPVLPVYGARAPNCPPSAQPASTGQATPGAPPAAECPPPGRSGSSTSSSGSRTHYWFGGQHMGSSDAAGSARALSPSATGTSALSGPASPSVARGGLGAAGRGFASASS